MALDEEDQGLGLITEPPGSEPLAPATELGGLGLATEPPADVPAAPTSKEPAYGKPSKLATALDILGSGLSGRPMIIPQLQANQREQRKQNLQDVSTRLDITKEVTKQAQALPAEQRDKYLAAIEGQYDDPELKRMLKFAGHSPDVLAGYNEAVKTDPLIRSLSAKGKLTDFMETEVGQKYIRERSYPAFAKEWTTKTPELVNWTKENRPDVYAKALKDGKLTTTELRDIIDNSPENLKPTPNSTAYFFTPDGQKRLAGVIGIPVITDETAEKVQAKELESPDTTLVKYLKELEEAEATHAGASGKDKANAERRVAALKKKVLSETEGKQPDALKEMRNGIILKTAKMKETQPNYQMPAHEKFIIDEFNKADAVERLRSDILQGRSAEVAKGGSGPSLEEFVRESKRAGSTASDQELKDYWSKKYGSK